MAHPPLVAPRTGIVRRLVPMKCEPLDAPVAIVGADVGTTAPLGGAGPVAASGAGGWTLEEAEQAALGEALERYCATFSPPVRRAAAEDLDGAITEWPRFTAAQRERLEHTYEDLEPDTVLDWCATQDLATGETAWVPAQWVGLPHHNPDDPMLGPAMSTGLAAGSDLDHALRMALYEIVERDAFTLMWLTQARPPRLDPAELPARAASLRRYGDFHVFDLTHDVGLPVYLCVLEKPSVVGNIICVGAACRHDPAAAVDKAVLEAFQTFPYVRDIVRREPDWRAEKDFSNLRDFRDHCRIYTLHPELRPGVAPFLDGPFQGVPLRPAEEGGVDDIVSRLCRVGLRSLAVELTTPDVAPHARVVRVLVPGAQPLHGHFHAALLDSDRLRRAEDILPYLKGPWEVSPWPHPFA